MSSRAVCNKAPVSSSHANGWGGCVQQFIGDEIDRAVEEGNQTLDDFDVF